MPALALSPLVDPVGTRADERGASGAAHSQSVDRIQSVDTVQALQARIDALQRTRLDTRLMPTHEALADLLPDGGLREGSVYALSPSSTLVMALLLGPSQAGSWCGIIGMPEFGVEAAEGLGLDLDRLVLVPHPGDQWLAVASTLADALGIVVVRPGRAASDGAVAKLAARLRERGSTLLVVGPWPQAEAMISITASEWSGLGDGHGVLAERHVTLTVTSRRDPRPRSGQLLLPDAEQGIHRLDPPALRRSSEHRARERWASPARRVG